ncbi:MAG: efflux RND transporter periplasmic adaptor subunit [Acidiferrobacterales bacterium]
MKVDFHMPSSHGSGTFGHALRRLRSPVGLIIMAIIGIIGIVLVLYTRSAAHAQAGRENRAGANASIPVTAATAQLQSMPVWLDALGTVTPLNYVNVMPRVPGLLQSVNYREGQQVRAGQLLATIDPRPYHIQVEQAQAQLMRDHAQLVGAQSDLARYETLLAQDSIARQQVDDQRATVAQLKGTVAADKAGLDNAQLQLAWTRITAPSSGIAGLRPVDAGNMVGTSGAIGGGNSAATGGVATSAPIVPIATLAQVQPIAVTFTVTQSQLPAILDRWRRNVTLPVQAWDQGRTTRLASGKVIAIDNQINTATGTVMLKAEFANPRMTLFPNQFVNVRLLVDTLAKAVVVPSAAVATGAPGSYVYVIDNKDKVAVRPVTAGVSDGDYTAITAGLKAGERVVTDGLDRLRDGSKVRVVAPLSNPRSTKSDPASRMPRGQPRAASNRG